MTINQVINESVAILKAAGVDASAAEARYLLCSLLHCSKAYLFAHGDEGLEAGLAMAYAQQIRRRAAGMPLQHIIGFQEFMSLEFEVNGNVLIPRQDTEILVEAVLGKFSSLKRPVNLLDMCTGSGCIAVSLAYYLQDSRITAVDVSSEAIAVAARNACRHGVQDRIEFVCRSLFEELSGTFDAIVSNPPYIPNEDIAGLSVEVRDFEPRLALDGGRDGLDFYRTIAAEAPGFLQPGGLLVFETGYDQARQVADIMSPYFSKLDILKDLAGIDRVVMGYRR